MKLSAFIGQLFLGILRAVIISLLVYVFTKDVDFTYYFALGAAIGSVIYDTVKVIAAVKQPTTTGSDEGEE